MRPRRLSTPAISGGASGTRVSRSGMNTSCTRDDRQAEQLAADHRGDVFGQILLGVFCAHGLLVTPRDRRRSAP